ncbi:MAG: multicomponent Na+:H+ antiporter subunit [Thermoleophilaceae bacterium]|nr:multicomponent Na+:H+ antiporter subunit [Thermoleophilaceae bacterium]
MSDRVRLPVFGVGLAGLLGLMLWAFAGLPDFGDYAGPYGYILNRVAVPERSTTDVVTAVNFDYRGFDTLAEEFILFASVVGVASILRKLRGERTRAPDDDAAGRRVPETSLTVRVAGLGLVAPTILVGIYIVAHGQLTPGGGFQGGVILATALLLIYLSADYMTMRAVGPSSLIELAEGLGGAAFALIGLSGLIAGGAFFQNWLGKGTVGDLLSSGTIPLSNAAVGLAVTGGFAFMLSEFLQQTLTRRRVRRGRSRRSA